MNWNKRNTKLETHGELIDIIKISNYYYVLIVGILIIVSLILLSMNNKTFNIRLIIYLVTLAKIIQYAIQKIYIYDKCIIIGKTKINYEDVSSVRFIERRLLSTRSYRTQKYFQINFKNEDDPYELPLIFYSVNQFRTILKYIEEYSKCKIENAYEYLDKKEIQNKKDLIISLILIAIFIVVAIIFIKFCYLKNIERLDNLKK